MEWLNSFYCSSETIHTFIAHFQSVDLSYYFDLFNPREKAILMWIAVFLIFCVTQKKVRVSLIDILKTLLTPPILKILVEMFLYVSFMIWVFYQSNFWDFTMAKDSLIWFCTSAIVLLFDANNASKNEHYFRKLVYDNLKLVLVLEFIINFYTFSFWIEMILIPLLFLFTGISAVASLYQEHSNVKKMADFILMIFGASLFIFIPYKIYSDFQSLLKFENFRTFLLPSLLTFAYIPFLYLIALFMAYETLFLRIDCWLLKNDKPLAKFTKFQIFRACFINLGKLNRFVKEDAMNLRDLNSRADVLKIIEEFNKRQRLLGKVGAA